MTEIFVSAEPYDMKEGRVVSLLYQGDIFDIRLGQKEVVEKLTTKTPFVAKEKGKLLITGSVIGVWENPVKEILVGNDFSKEAIMSILQKYHNVKKKTLYGYARDYCKYFGRTTQGGIFTTPEKKVPLREGKLKGKSLAKDGHNTVYENVYNDFLHASTKEDKYKILDEYYPNSSESSKKVYARMYSRYQERQQPSYREGKRKYHRIKAYSKRKPKDSVGKSKKYNLYIKKGEYETVLRLIHTAGNVANKKMLEKETGIKPGRMSAIIDFMVSNNDIYKVRKIHDVYYIPCIKDITPFLHPEQ